MQWTDQCPICGADSAAARLLYRRSRDCLFGCGRCRSAFSNPRYTRDELDELYRREYYDENVGDRAGRWAVQDGAETLHRTVLDLIGKGWPDIVQPGRRVLDFGCGLGRFLAEAVSRGMTGVGVDLSSVAAAEARRLALDVRAGDELALDDLDDGSFDLVVGWSVIEHVLAPRDVLRRLAGKVGPEGVLGLAWPNLRCWRTLIDGGRWFNFANPTHLNFPTLAAMKALLRQLGLTDVRRCIYFGGRPGFGRLAGAAQLLARRLGVGSELRVFAARPDAAQPAR